MSRGFIKLHRDIDQHWVNTRSDWFHMWSIILLEAEHKTGKVDLTAAYKKLPKDITKKAWHYFIEKLCNDDMLCDLEVVNLGDKAGKVQTAKVANYAKYHQKPEENLGNSERNSQGTANFRKRNSEPQVPQGFMDDLGTAKEQPISEKGTAKGTVYKEYNSLEEVKRINKEDIYSEDPKNDNPLKFVSTLVGHNNAYWMTCQGVDLGVLYGRYGADGLKSIWENLMRDKKRFGSDTPAKMLVGIYFGSFRPDYAVPAAGETPAATKPTIRDYLDKWVIHPAHGKRYSGMIVSNRELRLYAAPDAYDDYVDVLPDEVTIWAAN